MRSPPTSLTIAPSVENVTATFNRVLWLVGTADGFNSDVPPHPAIVTPMATTAAARLQTKGEPGGRLLPRIILTKCSGSRVALSSRLSVLRR